MPGWLPPTYFIWPAPMLGFCTSCGKVETKNGWVDIPAGEKMSLFKQNIEWERKPCPACVNIAPATASSEALPAAALALVRSAG